MVGDTGIEPVTFPVSGGRSPAELIAHPWQASILQPSHLQVSPGACVVSSAVMQTEREGLTGV